MGEYEKYFKINEYIETLKLDSAANEHYRDMLNRLSAVRDKEASGSLGDEDQREKETIMNDLDSFIEKFIQTKKKEIDDKITAFQNHVNGFTKKINKITEQFVLSGEIDLGINGIINELHDGLKEIIEVAKDLIREIDEWKEYFAAYTDDAMLAMDYSDINSIINEFKDRLKDLKQIQIDNYNAKVTSINDKIEEFKNMEGISDEVRAKIDRLTTLSTCDYYIKSWNNNSYLGMLDYNKILEINMLIIEIENDLGMEQKPTLEEDLDSDINYIEWKIEMLDGKIREGMTNEEIDQIRSQISDVANRITGYEVKLNNNKDNITEEVYNTYMDRVCDAQKNLAELNNKLGKTFIIDADFEKLRIKLKLLNGEINEFSYIVESLYGNITESAVKGLEDRLVTYEGRLEDIKKDIEEKKSAGKLDPNQYDQLNKLVEQIENKLKETKNKLKEPEMVLNVDIFSFLNGQLDGLEKAVDALENEVESLQKPIKDRATRKAIDKQIKYLEEEAKFIEEQLEKHKEDDPEKYEAAKERLDKVKEKLEKVGKNYRKKCPLLIKAVKSAKNFFKKHKKICLIIAGLAAIALIHATVGPIIIPAIMHGNIMIGTTAPALAGFTNFVNNILGGMINAAKVTPSMWRLANGTIINAAGASTSLLKGLAISGLGTSALLAPMIATLIAAIKKLKEKMKNINLKNELKKIKTKVDEHRGQRKPKDNTKKADRLAAEELAKLFREFRKSGKSLDEFCLENNISEEEKSILQYLDMKSKENAQSLENNGRGGRR